MNKWLKMLPWVAALVALAMLSGCAAICGVEEKKVAVTPPPPPPKVYKAKPAPVTAKPAPPPALPTSYTVEKCDDLYTISAKPQIYNDPWLWPILFDANKDKINNANKIWPGTVLQIPRNVSDQQKTDARARAKKFPKYVPPPGAKRYCPPK